MGDIRNDGYKNVLSKYGTKEDLSENYRFESVGLIEDMELTVNYEENGLFGKIIDLPAEEAVSSGFKYNTSEEIAKFIDDSLDELNFEEMASLALKWTRLYGGALIVMIVDDGRQLDAPIDWDNIRGIDELMVFERPLIIAEDSSIYKYNPSVKGSKFGKPEFYTVTLETGGQFRVHESRCLLFRNGTLPRLSFRTAYRHFGIPEFVRIHKELQETVTAHGNGIRLLDRAVQAIYKMKDLAELLNTEEGEFAVVKRLQLIDMAKGILNSIAIDSAGEDYDYKQLSFAGVKDIIDSACNMLSAVTNIPQTKLFGRSPAGMNSTGEADLENYYSYVNKIQKINLKKNMGILIDIILIVGKGKGIFDEIPQYQLEFKPLWSLSEAEQAEVNNKNAATEFTKAQTAQIYVDMQALDAAEVRKRLSEDGTFTINDILEAEEDWNGVLEESVESMESEETSGTALSAENKASLEQSNGEIKSDDNIKAEGCGVIVVKNGKILVGTRKDNGKVCGPGGHIEQGESAEEAAIREAMEEFGIYISELIPLTLIPEYEETVASQVFLCTEFFGTPICFNTEMEDARFEDIGDLMQKDLFLPFKESLNRLNEKLSNTLLTRGTGEGTLKVDGGPGSGRKPDPNKKGESENDKEMLPEKVSSNKRELHHNEKNGIIASSTGPNILKVKGFKNKQALNNHWQNGRTHAEEYKKDGITTKEQYVKRAVELAEKPVGNGVLGYKTKDGLICRYDVEKNDYVKASIDKGIKTLFKPIGEMDYYNLRKKVESDDE